jgi:hypothetical protein
MIQFNKEMMLYLLRSFDEYCYKLGARLTLILIGGAAFILEYDLPRYTNDIDIISSTVINSKGIDFESFGISIVSVGILNLPSDFQSRLHKINGYWNEIFALDAIDLILLKLGRGDRKDIEDCKYLIESEQVNINELLRIYEDWKIDYIGNVDRLDANMQFILGELW